MQHTCDAIVAHAAPVIPYRNILHRTTWPTPLTALATTKDLRGPKESFMPRLETEEKASKYDKNCSHWRLSAYIFLFLLLVFSPNKKLVSHCGDKIKSTVRECENSSVFRISLPPSLPFLSLPNSVILRIITWLIFQTTEWQHNRKGN